MAIEIQCIKMRATTRLKDIKIREHRALLSMYADDCTIFLENTTQDLRNAVAILKEFYRLSGLQDTVRADW